jgi:hypothetical protein
MWLALIRAEGDERHMGDVFLTKPLGNQVTSQSMWPCTGIGSSTSVDFYFSRIRGIKMDTNNSETKQGVVVPADLLKQKPHVEVIPT